MRRCTKCGRTADETTFYAAGSWCCPCKRATSRAHRSVYYQTHGDQVRAYARAYRRRWYHAMTADERRAHNRDAWRRWGRPRYDRTRTSQQQLRAEARQLSREVDRLLLPQPIQAGNQQEK